jgi:hypothetical protein
MEQRAYVARGGGLGRGGEEVQLRALRSVGDHQSHEDRHIRCVADPVHLACGGR